MITGHLHQMRRKLLGGFISQTVTHLDRPEIVLLGCFSSFQGDYDEYSNYDEYDYYGDCDDYNPVLSGFSNLFNICGFIKSLASCLRFSLTNDHKLPPDDESDIGSKKLS